MHYSIENVNVLKDKSILFDLRLWISNLGRDVKHVYAKITTLIFHIQEIFGEKLTHKDLGRGVHEFVWREDTRIFYKDYSENLGVVTLLLHSGDYWGTIKLELRAESIGPKFKEIEPKRELLEDFRGSALVGTIDQPYSEKHTLTPSWFVLKKKAERGEIS